MFYNVKQSEKHAMIDKSNWKSSEEFDFKKDLINCFPGQVVLYMY